jgi:crossover junction endodeoxyribonuclease RuvC
MFMKIMGIDPGFQRVGWAIVEGNKAKQRLVDYGCIETSAKDTMEERLEQVYDQLVKQIDYYQPESVAVEDIYYFKNQKTIIGVSQARGVILLAIHKQKLPCFHYTPLQIKNTIAGFGRAEKQQVQMMVKAQLRLKEIPKPDDAADACAVALTRMFMR